jgi:DNA-binding LacI/PurR family transcriptional regulator
LDVFDGVLFLSQPGEIPARLLEKIRSPQRRIVGFGSAFDPDDVPCIDLLPPQAIHSMLDHLYELGHRRIACLNTQPVGSSENRRIATWEEWCGHKGVDGTLINRPVGMFEQSAPHAYRVMMDELNASPLRDTAIFCVTESAAVGAMRALRENSIQIGPGVAVCAIGDLGLNRFYGPSLTALEVPDPRPFIGHAVEWMLSGDKPWQGPRIMMPRNLGLFVGESTSR